MKCSQNIECLFINDGTNNRSTFRTLRLYLWSLFFSRDGETSRRLCIKTRNVVNGSLHDSRPLRNMSVLYGISENYEIVTGVNQTRCCLNLPNRRFTKLRFEMKKRPLLRTGVLKYRSERWKNCTSYTNINGREPSWPETYINWGFWELQIIWGNVMMISISTEYSYIFYWHIPRKSLELMSLVTVT